MQGDIMRATLEFQSTLSVRRATAGVVEQCAGSGISIHALREESDGSPAWHVDGRWHFNPRSP